MTHPTPGGAGLRIAAAMPSSTPVSQCHLERNILRYGVAARRHRLAEIETSMVEACERAAVRGARRNVRMDDCKTWDKATWQRHPAGRRAARTGLPAPDAPAAPGHRQIRAAAHFANSSRARCMTLQTTGVYLRSTGSVTSPTPRSCVRLSDTRSSKRHSSARPRPARAESSIGARVRHDTTSSRSSWAIAGNPPNLVHNDRSDENRRTTAERYSEEAPGTPRRRQRQPAG
jgi:hypothetical protein